MTPLDMATCAAVAWAGLATVGAGGVYALLRQAGRERDRWFREAMGNLGRWGEAEADRVIAKVERGRLTAERDAANKRWSRAMHLLHTAEKQNRALVDAQLAGELERLVA